MSQDTANAWEKVVQELGNVVLMLTGFNGTGCVDNLFLIFYNIKTSQSGVTGNKNKESIK